MLKYHVAVCDDEKSDLDGIVQSVQQYDVQGCFDIETYMDGNELLSELQMQKISFWTTLKRTTSRTRCSLLMMAILARTMTAPAFRVCWSRSKQGV